MLGKKGTAEGPMGMKLFLSRCFPGSWEIKDTGPSLQVCHFCSLINIVKCYTLK